MHDIYSLHCCFIYLFTGVPLLKYFISAFMPSKKKLVFISLLVTSNLIAYTLDFILFGFLIILRIIWPALGGMTVEATRVMEFDMSDHTRRHDTTSLPFSADNTCATLPDDDYLITDLSTGLVHVTNESALLATYSLGQVEPTGNLPLGGSIHQAGDIPKT